ncbi:M23 family metallopeptidase [Pelodictyon luteolum]|uniref:Membrane proteins related to metalloendopeptidases-like protein n=1 Tax=Chlorobium luteolum (strain DSM 273 / BCRC 81028 / 2530) TaxID=319225 RepID=Q3B1A6_CHLL3|nr:M23 family metallopeptidase [Pelodictyon luteolum]ABB24875.1 Membrane proteins related to metalloendopeptidases-like protein [Pelodictyon luteolum DSM 273]
MHPFRPIFRTFALLTPMLLIVAASVLARTTLEVDVARNSLVQGGFVTVDARGTETAPVVSFMEKEWPMFRQEDGSWQALVPVENLSEPGRYSLTVSAGERRRELPVTVKPNGLKVQYITLSPSKSSLHATAIEKSRVKAALMTITPDRLFAEGFIRPCKGETSSLFGLKRSYNGGPATSYHKGIDIAAPQGTAVHSTAGGRVVLAGTVPEGFEVHGNTVILDHGQGVTSVYLHLDSISVKEGQRVEKGGQVGTVGHTGISTAPHLHWGVYLYGVSVNPELFLVNRPVFLRARR